MNPTEIRVRELLADVYTPKGIRIWLTSRNTMLGMHRPADLLADPKTADDVLQVAEWVAAP